MSTSSYVSELLTWIDILFLSPPLISFHLIFVSFDYPFSFLTKQILVLFSSCQPLTQCQPANTPMSWNSFSQGTIWSTSTMGTSFSLCLSCSHVAEVQLNFPEGDEIQTGLSCSPNLMRLSLVWTVTNSSAQAGDQAHCPLISTLKLWLNGACCIIHHPQWCHQSIQRKIFLPSPTSRIANLIP